VNDHHVQAANKLFRDAGVTIAAMQWPRCADAIAAIRRFNGLPDTAPTPVTWRYHPNQWCAANWRKTYGVEE
jgi:hypothetical protein